MKDEINHSTADIFIIRNFKLSFDAAYFQSKNSRKQKKKIAKTIIIDRTTIPVLEGEERKDIEDELTMNIRDFLEEGNFFDRVLLFTEKDSSLKNMKVSNFIS